MGKDDFVQPTAFLSDKPRIVLEVFLLGMGMLARAGLRPNQCKTSYYGESFRVHRILSFCLIGEPGSQSQGPME